MKEICFVCFVLKPGDSRACGKRREKMKNKQLVQESRVMFFTYTSAILDSS